MSQSQPETSSRDLVSIITASSAGTLIEWYDFYIFGSLATIISTHLFPKDNPTAAFLATLATFAAGLVIRPFGAMFFGRMGDMIGRKYTFMTTMVIMGGSTFAIGLVPDFDKIGFWAPVIVLVLRLLQGLAIGGEYGGAATFVAEHAPVHKRGLWTSWIQISVILGFITSLGVIEITKSSMGNSEWEAWGWRIPFLASVVLLGISVWIRRNMSESPLFLKAKSEGNTSANPLKESFGNKANLKVVLLALFGLTTGVAAIVWSSLLYAQTFLIRMMQVDYDQANKVVMTGILMGSLTIVFSGWLSDRIGRKPLVMISLFLALLFLRPIFGEMYQTTNLQNKIRDAAGKSIQRKTEPAVIPGTLTKLITISRQNYTDGTISEEIKNERVINGKTEKTESSKSIILCPADFRKLVMLVFLLTLIPGLAYGPLAAFLVEMFPLKIRYTSMSLPFHIGFGIIGGMSQVVTTYLIGKANNAHRAQYYLAGLSYPILLAGISLLIGLLYLQDKKKSVFLPVLSRINWNGVKKYMGIIWVLLGLAAAYYGIFQLGIPKIRSGNQEDLIFGMVVMIVITPIASIGLIIFGKYAFDGEYNVITKPI